MKFEWELDENRGRAFREERNGIYSNFARSKIIQ